ncbi:MAG TPA: hypothetical protein VMX94_06835 [Armatimonadota bacterium]|nr:hypothetical protein [Armatimonadota bacterium]
MERTHLEPEPGPAAVSTEPILSWKVHILRESPGRMFLVGPVVLGSLLASYIMFQSLLVLAVAAFLLISALAEFLFPIRFVISEHGAFSRTLLSRTYIEWDRVKKYYLDDRGIKLSPLEPRGRLEAYRGVYLRFGGNRDEVIEAVRRMRDARCANDETGR